MRLVVFLALVLAVSWSAAASPELWPVAIGGVALAAAAFLALVAAHRRERERAWRHEQLRAVNALGVERVRRAWDALPQRSVAPPLDHPYAGDLNVVGRASLLHLLDVVSAAPGRPTLLGWLLEPPAPPDILRARQAAVAELATATELREELAALARMAGDVRGADVERFRAWAEGEPWLLRRPLLLWSARVLPIGTLGGLALFLAGSVSWLWWAIPTAAAGLVIRWTRDPVERTMRGVAAGPRGLRYHAEMLGRLAAQRFESPLLARLRERITAGGGARRQLGRLERVIAWTEVRHSPMLHAVLKLLFLWDLHAVAALERWRIGAGAHVRDWFQALGEGETLAALAMLAHDNPGWTFPELRDDGAAIVEAESLGHPLLPEEERVGNDVTVGPPGTVLLVTGSNMSGKSTLLRAIGTNIVLAQAGGPVCAARMRMPLVRLHTSIRIEDSLEQGISLFMAELRRLKGIVDAARAAGPARPLLYLLDEILHGTNTAERQVAARTVLGHLIRSEAIGAVTTHDLTLAQNGVLSAAARPVHFTETVTRTPGGLEMTFDYLLHPGLATSANALSLLEMVGLGDGAGVAARDSRAIFPS